MFRIKTWTEDARGVEVISTPWPDGWRFGLLLLEPLVGGWDQKMFIGWFRREETEHGR